MPLHIYLVMDDLDVTPLASIISSRHRLMKFSDHELEEVVRLGMDEVYVHISSIESLYLINISIKF